MDKFKFFLAVFLLLISGCAGLGTRSVNKDELNSVKRVAIASFSLVHPRTKTLISIGGSSGMDESFPDMDSDVTKDFYNDLAETLRSKYRWRTLTSQAMVQNNKYQATYKEKMLGVQFNKIQMKGQVLRVPEVMDAQSLRRMSVVERDALATALNVDLLIEAQVQIYLETKGIAVMGIASRYPQARVFFNAYKKGVEAPVWFEGKLDGEMSEKSISKTGHFDEDEMLKYARVSAKSAFAKLNFRL